MSKNSVKKPVIVKHQSLEPQKGKSEKDKKELSFEVKKLLKNEGLTLDNF